MRCYNYYYYDFLPFLQSTEWNALFFAAKDGNWDLTKLFIQNGANVFLKDKVCYDTILLADINSNIGLTQIG